MLTEQQVRDIVAQNKKVAVKVFQDGCPWCDKYAPLFSEAASKHKDLVFASVNINNNNPSAFRDEFMGGKKSVPATLLFEDGKVKATAWGYIDGEQLDEFISTGKYTPKKPAKPDPREWAIKASMEQLIKSVAELNIQIKEHELAVAIFRAELERRNILLPKAQSCDDCKTKKFQPWKREFWKTDCKLCLRLRYGMLGALSLLALWYIYG